MGIAKTLSRWIPPVLGDWAATLRGAITRFQGPYPTWEQAVARAQGYDNSEILRRVRAATREVVQGRARWERDGVAFHSDAYPFPLIALLLRAALEHDGRLNVLDFGGSLGTSYYQCREFLSEASLSWSVIEQKHFVDCGKHEFTNDVLRFYYAIDECVKSGAPHVVLASGVLQYLPTPLDSIKALAAAAPNYIILDRIPVAADGRERIMVQVNPSRTNRSSYPTWFFEESRFQRVLAPHYKKITSFDAVDGVRRVGNSAVHYRGLIFRRTH